MRPIDADKLEYKEVIEPMKDRDGMIYPLHYLVVKKTDIMCAPILDVAPVKHGEWAKTGQSFVYPNRFLNYCCSICGYDIEKTKYNYCPNCGAKMKGEEE